MGTVAAQSSGAQPCARWYRTVATPMLPSPLLSCLCPAEEQFILSQVALLEQVNALMPMLDSASIKGTPLGLQLHSRAWGGGWWGQGFPV